MPTFQLCLKWGNSNSILDLLPGLELSLGTFNSFSGFSLPSVSLVLLMVSSDSSLDDCWVLFVTGPSLERKNDQIDE